MPIVACNLCNALPQKASANLQADQTLPEAARRLETICREEQSGSHSRAFSVDSLKRCPCCGTFYSEHYFYDGPEYVLDPICEGINLSRMSPARAIERLSGVGTADALEALHDLQSRQPELVEEYVAALIPLAPANWQITKYLIESLTDAFMLAGDWGRLEAILFRHPDPVVRVEAATDFIYLATEEYPVWCWRFFTKELQDAARFFWRRKKTKARLVEVLIGVLQAPEAFTRRFENPDYSPFSTYGQAVVGLGFGAYRWLDISPALPMLAPLLCRDAWFRQEILHALDDLVKRRPVHVPATMEAIAYAGLDPKAPEIIRFGEDGKRRHEKWLKTNRHGRTKIT